MGHCRIFSATLAAALAAAVTAHAGPTAPAQATTEIQGHGGIEATGQVIFQDLMIPSIQMAPITASSVDTANVSLLGEASAVSLAVPQAVDVSAPGNADSLKVMTELSGDQISVYGMDSLVGAGGVLSVDIGGLVALRPEEIAPGKYSGLLVVVAQYN